MAQAVPALETAPPRSIRDITQTLAHYQPNQAAAQSQQAIANAEPAADLSPAARFQFFVHRAEAAGQLGRLAQQRADLQQAIALGVPQTAPYARVLRTLAVVEMQAGNLLDAVNLTERSIQETPRNSSGQLTGSYMVAVLQYAMMGDFALANRYLLQLEALLNRLKNSRNWDTHGESWQGNYTRAKGEVLRLRGKPVEAEQSYRQALALNQSYLQRLPDLLKQGIDAPSIDTMLRTIEALERNIALTLLAQGKVIAAEAMARQNLQKVLQRASSESVDAIASLRILATTLAEQGRERDAQYLLQQGIRLGQQLGLAPEAFALLQSKQAYATSLVATGQDQAALAVFNEIQNTLKTQPDLASKTDYQNIAWVYALLRSGQYPAALAMSTSLAENSRKLRGQNSFITAEAEAFHAVALFRSGQSEAAKDAFLQSVPLLVKQANQDSQGDNASERRRQRLAYVIENYLDLLYQQRQNKLGNAGNNVGQLSVNDPLFRGTFRLAEVARSSRVQQALMQSAARASFSDPALADLARQEQDAGQESRALGEILNKLLTAPPAQQLPSIQAKLQADLQLQQQRQEQLRQELAQRYPEYANLIAPAPIEAANLQNQLKLGELLVTWYFGEEKSWLWAMQSNGGKALVAEIPLTRRELARQVQNLRRALDPQVGTIEAIPAFQGEAAYALFQALFAPIQPWLAESKVLVAIPHAELGQLPLGLLLTAPPPNVTPKQNALLFSEYQTYPWLIRQVAIANLPSANALLSLRRQATLSAQTNAAMAAKERLPFIGFGDPLFTAEQGRATNVASVSLGGAMRGVMRGVVRLRNIPQLTRLDSAGLNRLARLPETADEITDIARSLGAGKESLYLQQAASEKNVLSLPLQNYRVVMFATHGLIPGDLNGLDQPALALTNPSIYGGDGDGLLTQTEILPLQLNADWVVLSACNTAAGDGAGGEAVSGLGRAFFYAGARALLVSNWPVESESARSLMTQLFAQQKGGSEQNNTRQLSKADYLRQASLALLDGPGQINPQSKKSEFSYAHPLFWAPFVMVGD